VIKKLVLKNIPGRDKAIIWFALGFGAVGWFFHSYLIFDAWRTDTEWAPKWVTTLDYNFYGEGVYELILFPLVTLFIVYAFYVYAKDFVN